MNCERIVLTVPGQKTGAAELRTYILDPVSVAPQKRRPMVVVVPGGGYRKCSDRESEPIAMQFLAMGCHACVLNYSVAPNRYPTSLLELELAVAVVRDHADAWLVDLQAVLVCGFSAGGHLACCLGTFWQRSELCALVGRRPEEVRPDGLILCYPVITSGEHRHIGSMEKLLGEDAQTEIPGLWQELSLERQVSEQMPPVFLWHTLTDEKVPVENSLLLAGAMRRHGVSFELHIFPSGCHGLALASEETAGERAEYLEPCCQTWISLVQSWIGNRYLNR